MRASSGREDRVFKPLIQVSDERRKAPVERVDINFLTFFKKNYGSG
jgi:hypothetical protein